MPGAADHFSQSYAEARAKFLAATGDRKLDVQSHVLSDRVGVDGEALAIDVALGGAVSGPGLLVITSATHGLEGYCGSGAQIALLRDDAFLAMATAARVGVLFVHALNPFGFSHGRRVNEDNVDLNRNFRDFDAPVPVNDAYAEIHPLLVPAAWPPPAENDAAIAAHIARRGVSAWQAALTGGQYTFPDGLFFGARVPRGATGHCVPRCATTAARANDWGGSTFTRGSDRAATARRFTPVATSPRTWRGRVPGGDPKSRRSTTARPPPRG